MYEVAEKAKLACIGLFIFGAPLAGVSIWAMVGHMELKNGVEINTFTGTSPHLGISAGVILTVISAVAFFVKFDQKITLHYNIYGLLLCVGLTIATMVIAAQDIKVIEEMAKSIRRGTFDKKLIRSGIKDDDVKYVFDIILQILQSIRIKLAVTAILSGVSCCVVITAFLLVLIAIGTPITRRGHLHRNISQTVESTTAAVKSTK